MKTLCRTFSHSRKLFIFWVACALVFSISHAVAYAGGTVTVTASNPNGAATVGQASAALRFADGPGTPPLGRGSARLTTGSGGMKPDGSGLGGRQSLFFNRYNNTKLSNIDTLRFSSYKATTDFPAVTFSIRLSVDMNGGTLDPGDATTLIFEPVYNPTQGAVRTGVWQTWDAINSGNAVWWSAKAIPGVCATTCYYTLNRILASNPQATIYASGIQLVVGQNSAGAPWNNFDGYVDDLRVGVSGDTTTFNFENDTSTTRKVRNTNVGQTDRIYTQVDNAINAANPGDLIDVAPGIYPEQVEVDKNVKILGAGTRTTTITPPAISTPGQPTLAPLTTLNGNVLRPVIFANASQATLSNLTVDGSALGTENQRFAGIASNNADLSLDHLHITQTKSTPVSSTASGYGLYAVANSGTDHTLTLNRLSVDDYQAAGIVFSGANITAAATDTTVTGSGANSTLPQQGVRFENGANGSLDRVQIAAHRCEALTCGPNPFLQKAATGVTFDQAGMVHIQDSTLTNNDVGLQATTLADGHGMVDQTVVSGNRFSGLRVGSGQQMVNRSTIRSNGVGLQTVSKSTDAPVAKVFASGNTFTYNETAFATTDDQLGDGKAGQFTAVFNRVVNNDFGFKSQSDQVAGLQNNWWGCNSGINTAKCEKQQVEPSATPAQTEPHLTLTLTADKQTLNLDNPTTALTASVRRNSAGELTTADNFPLAPVTYTTTLGALQPTSGTLTSGDTRTIFNANGAIGQPLLTATLDNEQASTQLNVSPRIPAGNRDSDGDGLDDTADCAPNDAGRPYQAGPDLNCDGQPDTANQTCDAKCKIVIRQELLLTSCRFVRVKKRGKPTKRVRRCKVRRTRLKQEVRPYTTGRVAVKTVRLSRKQRRAVRKARRAKIQITITRTDQTGRTAVERRFVTLKPKKRKKKRKTGRRSQPTIFSVPYHSYHDFFIAITKTKQVKSVFPEVKKLFNTSITITDGLDGKAVVQSSSMPSTHAARYNTNMWLDIYVDGKEPYRIHHQCLVRAKKHPLPGQTLPVTVDRNNKNRIAIKWDEILTVDQRMAAGKPDANPLSGLTGSLDVAQQDVTDTDSSNTKIIDARGNPRAKTEIQKLLKQHGIDSHHLEGPITLAGPDANELQSEIFQIIQKHHEPTPSSESTADENDPTGQLQRLADLHQSGVLTDTEFQIAKTKILQSL